MIELGDLVKYDMSKFRPATLSEKQEQTPRPFGWLKDDYEGTEASWVGIISEVNTFGPPKVIGGVVMYGVLWSHGEQESVYSFEIEKIVDKP